MSNPIPTTSAPKKYPTTTAEVAKMLGISGVSHDLPMGTFSDAHATKIPNLPIAHDTHPAVPKTAPVTASASAHGDTHNLEADLAAVKAGSSNKFVKVAKAVAPYVLVFAAGLLLYSFFFTTVDFGSIFKSSPKAVTPKQTALQQLESQNLSGYKTWIAGFYYDVTDAKIIDPDTDNSGNGLTNFQKYLLNLNPKSYDTLGLGQADSQSLAQGIDPATGAPLTDSQKDVVAKYVDMEVAMNRLTLNRLQHPEQVAGIITNPNNGLINTANAASVFPPASSQVSTPTAPVTGADIIDGGISINTDIPGRLEIPDLKINVPIIWTKDTNNFEKDLQTGVVHYPGTALPGQIGTTYIAGHSSNYVWAKGDYNHVFTTLGDLADNTSFKITVVQTNGKDAIFHYVVTHRKQYLPTDQEQFTNTGKSVVALSTCWPINSTSKRLVVFGELTQTDK